MQASQSTAQKDDHACGDPLVIGSLTLHSRLLLGTSGYPNMQVLLESIATSGTELITVAIRRINLMMNRRRDSFPRSGRYRLLCFQIQPAATQLKKPFWLRNWLVRRWRQI